LQRTDSPSTLRFGPFRLDPNDERLWRGDVTVPLGARGFAVLHLLARRPGRLVPKDELLDAVWEGRAVTDGVLTTAVHEIRQALGDDRGEPAYVETVYGRGYRFVAPVEAGPPPPASLAALPAAPPGHDERPLVGRERGWAELARRGGEAFGGERRIVFVAGEAGVGKTALCEAFLHGLGGEQGPLVARGQCVESYGRGEAYLPLLEAFGRLLRSDDGEEVAAAFELLAPSWLVHLAPRRPAGEGDPPEGAGGGATPARMLRELAEAVETLAERRPVALLLEDLHWSDTATLAWLDYVARRPDPARLLVLATYRPVEVAVQGHPLRTVVSDAVLRPTGGELVLDHLSAAEVGDFVARRFPGLDRAGEVARALHARTGGQPLFLVTLADELVRRGVLAARGDGSWRTEEDFAAIETVVPATLAAWVDERVERLAAGDRRLVEAAAVAGPSFDAAVLAAALGAEAAEVDSRLAEWARLGELVELEGAEARPGGAASTRFAFRHALLHDVVLRRVAPARRAAYHLAVARALETRHAGRLADVATELAVHFEAGGDARAAAAHRLRAARTASARSAYGEAIGHADRGLRLLAEPGGGAAAGPAADRDLEARLHLARGLALSAHRGWAAPETARSFRRARELRREGGDEEGELVTLWGASSVAVVTGGLAEAERAARRMLDLARRRGAPVFEIAARLEFGVVAFERGELDAARGHLARGAELYDPAHHADHVALVGVDLGVFTRAFDAHRAWLAADPDSAEAAAASATGLAGELGHPFSLAVATSYAAALELLRRDPAAALRSSGDALTLCTEHGFFYYQDWARAVRGWARAAAPDVSEAEAAPAREELRTAADSLRSSGRWRLVPLFEARLAERLLAAGREAEGAAALDRACEAIARSGAEVWTAEVLAAGAAGGR